MSSPIREASEQPGSASTEEPTSTRRAEITLREAQAAVDAWVQTIGVRYFHELTNLAQLVEEVGEVARILSRTCGEQSLRAGQSPGELADELADVLFVTICLANQSGIDLTDALRRNLEKKTIRDADRHRENESLRVPARLGREPDPLA